MIKKYGLNIKGDKLLKVLQSINTTYDVLIDGMYLHLIDIKFYKF